MERFFEFKLSDDVTVVADIEFIFYYFWSRSLSGSCNDVIL